MKKLVMFPLMLLAFTVTAQEAKKDTSYWQKKTEFGMTFNQGTFSKSWQGGGLSSTALGAFFNSKGVYRKAKDTWTNDLQLQFGYIQNKGQTMRKSIDRVFFDSQYGRKIGKGNWYFTGGVNLLSQFANGFDFNDGRTPRISGFFSPAFLTEAIGFQYKPSKHFDVTFSPLALRQTILTDKHLHQAVDAISPTYKFANYGVTRGKGLRSEIALLQLVANLDKDVAKNVNLKARYQAFASMDDLAAIDNRLDAQLTGKINKYMNFNLGLVLLYDQDQISKMQVAQSMGLSFLYTF